MLRHPVVTVATAAIVARTVMAAALNVTDTWSLAPDAGQYLAIAEAAADGQHPRAGAQRPDRGAPRHRVARDRRRRRLLRGEGELILLAQIIGRHIEHHLHHVFFSFSSL